MKLTKEYIEKIRPKACGVSDKYSWNIYRFLRKYRTRNIRVLDTKDHGRIFCFNIFPPCGQKLSLGFGYSGRKISAILTLNWNQSLETYFYTSSCEDYRDITEDFFKKYLRIGRCIFDPDHCWEHDSKIRYVQVNKNSRKCKWCGAYFNRKIVKKVEIRRVTYWEREEKICRKESDHK